MTDPASFNQGLALFEYGSHHNCLPTLRYAAKKFQQVIEPVAKSQFGAKSAASFATGSISFNSQTREAWHLWAKTLARIAFLSGKKEDLLKASLQIEQALQFLLPEQTANLYWDAGMIHFRLAELSGEIDDLFKAIASFEKSGENMPTNFWNDLGKAYTALAEKFHDKRPVLKAVQYFKQGVSQTPSNFEGWVGLGKNFKRLYQMTHENTYFEQASESFKVASHLNPQLPQLWFERIEFLLEVARQEHDRAKLQTALEWCQSAPSSPYLYGLWAEALALLGEWDDSIHLIRQAEDKLRALFEQCEEEDFYLLHSYGKCLFSFARYYHDLDLYYQAIEQFQASLSIDRTEQQGWIWMGKVYMELFHCFKDLDALEKAVYFYHKALQIRIDPFLYFEVAIALIHLGETERNPALLQQALDYLEYFSQVHLRDTRWSYYYGMALDLLGDFEEEASLHHQALDLFRAVLMSTPHDGATHHRIALAYSHLGEAVGEIDYFLRAIHHFQLSQQVLENKEIIYLDWGVTWINLSQHRASALMEENDFHQAEHALMQAARLGNQHALYPLACLYSLQGLLDLSLHYLNKARQAGTLPPLEEVLDDDWLESVRLTPAFQEFLALLQKS